MATSTWFYQQSMPVILFSVFCFLLTTAFAAQILGLGQQKRRYPNKIDTSDFLASTLLGLLALLLSFTLSMAIARFEGRRQLAIDEANTIGTAFLRTRLVTPAHGDAIANFMKQYVDSRIEFYNATWRSKQAEASKILTKTLQKQIWQQVTQLTRANRGALENGFVTTLNTMFDVENARTIAHEKTIPETVYWVILFVATIGICTYSFNCGLRGNPRPMQSLGLVITFTLLLVLIQDIDRPHGGLVVISQDAMLALRESMN